MESSSPSPPAAEPFSSESPGCAVGLPLGDAPPSSSSSGVRTGPARRRRWWAGGRCGRTSSGARSLLGGVCAGLGGSCRSTVAGERAPGPWFQHTGIYLLEQKHPLYLQYRHPCAKLTYVTNGRAVGHLPSPPAARARRNVSPPLHPASLFVGQPLTLTLVFSWEVLKLLACPRASWRLFTALWTLHKLIKYCN